MNLAALLDPASAAIVAGGTLLGALMRCGWRDCHASVAALARLGHRAFDAEAARAEMAVQIREIRQDGLVRAPAHDYADPELAEATGALLGRRSLSGLIDAHEEHKARRLEESGRASRTLAQAAELAPVFGLAGTLVSLSQLPAQGVAQGAFAGAISMAVLTTLYGLLLANLVFAPLARIVDRAAQAEERERRRLVDWLAAQVAPTIPATPRPRGVDAPAADRAA